MAKKHLMSFMPSGARAVAAPRAEASPWRLVEYDLTTFLKDANLTDQTREVAWGMLAEALRAAAPLDEDPPIFTVRPGVTPLRELLGYFANDLDLVEDVPPGEAGILPGRVFEAIEESLAGHHSKFPFGELTLDEEGRVKDIRVTSLNVDDEDARMR